MQPLTPTRKKKKKKHKTHTRTQKSEMNQWWHILNERSEYIEKENSPARSLREWNAWSWNPKSPFWEEKKKKRSVEVVVMVLEWNVQTLWRRKLSFVGYIKYNKNVFFVFVFLFIYFYLISKSQRWENIKRHKYIHTYNDNIL